MIAAVPEDSRPSTHPTGRALEARVDVLDSGRSFASFSARPPWLQNGPGRHRPYHARDPNQIRPEQRLHSNSEPAPRAGDDNAILHAGLVLIVIGLLASAATVVWNWSLTYPEVPDLIPSEGRHERIHLESFRSRTARNKWFVLDVATPAGPDSKLERWILPDFSPHFSEPLESLVVGDHIEGLVEQQDRLIRGAEHPVRVLWSVTQDGAEVIPYSLVLDVEESVRRNSPTIGLTTSLIGVALLGFRRIYRG
jgi:hypothetical protein